MSTDQNQISPNWNKLEEEESQGPGFIEVLRQTLRHWPWLLLSVCVCMGIGVLYILKTPKTYTESASVVIKDESEGRSSSIVNNFNDLGLFSNNTNVQNEIATMASPDVMFDVVRLLNLDIDCYAPGTFHRTALYGESLPVNVSFPGLPAEEQVSLKLDIDPKGKVSISKLKKFDGENGKWIKYDKTFTGSLGTPVETSVGAVTVTPTKYYAAGEDIEIEVDKKRFSSTVNSYTDKLKVSLADDLSTVLDLSISDQNRQRADDVLNAVIAVYNENWIKEKNKVAVSTSSFINDRLGVIENELGNVDSDISSYKSANLVPDVQAMAENYMKESQDLSQQLLELEGQLLAARNLRTRLTKAGDNGNALPANTTLENPALQAQIKEYNELLLKRNTLESKSSDKNPIVQTLDNDVNEMRGAIIGSVDNAIQGLEGQIRGLQGARGTATSRIASSPTQAKYLLSVERQQKVKENLYLFLLQKREDNELNQAFTAYNTRVIKKPGGNGAPTSPKKSLILASAFLLGLLIPFGYYYLKDRFDTKIRSRKDLEGVATPLIGEIPLDSKVMKGSRNRKEENTEIIVKSGSRDVMNEAFRVLRTNVEFTRIHKEECNVLAITSFNPGSGKSFIAVNLAASMSLKGKRVLVVDGDFRRGSTSAYVGSPHKGIADYLAGHISEIKGVITGYPGLENLNVLPVGSTPPNPTELIESPAFSELIAKLREDYDYIIVDCPPIEVVADAQIIDTIADRTVFVVRAGLLEKSLLKELDKFYGEKKYRHMSFILNGTDTDRVAYGNYGRYTYGN